MPNTHHALTLGVVALVALSSGCSADSAPRASPNSPTAAESVEAAPSATPTPAPGWRDAYDDAELGAFDGALARLAEYEERSEPIWAAGKVTPTATALFQRYFPSPAWQSVRDKLATYESVEVRSTGIPTVRWSRASAVSLSQDGDAVTVVQCVDFQTVRTTQYGVEVDRDPVFAQPIERVVELRRAPGRPWLIYNLPEATAKSARPCPAAEGAV